MPKVDLTYQQVLDAVKQLTSQEQQQPETALRESRASEEFSAFTDDVSLWNAVGVGKGTGEPVARQHDQYLCG